LKLATTLNATASLTAVGDRTSPLRPDVVGQLLAVHLEVKVVSRVWLSRPGTCAVHA
jgi:hypothetical protein